MVDRQARLAISVDTAASSIGVSGPTLRRLIRKGAFPGVFIGRRVVVPLRALEDWLAAKAADNCKGVR